MSHRLIPINILDELIISASAEAGEVVTLSRCLKIKILPRKTGLGVLEITAVPTYIQWISFVPSS